MTNPAATATKEYDVYRDSLTRYLGDTRNIDDAICTDTNERNQEISISGRMISVKRRVS
jgi:hypothetical protein